MKRVTLCFFFLSFLVPCFAQMSISNPQTWGGNAPAVIDKIEYNIRPAGVYAEVSVVFELSVDDTYNNFSDTDQLEFVWDFSLDKNAVVNNSWLWIEDYISYGKIYEAGEGTAIYEGIVDRLQDPSILKKHSPSQYELRVYPVFTHSPRKVKLSYLIPMDFTRNNKRIDLGFKDLIEHSFKQPENITVNIEDSENWYHIPNQISEVTTYTNNGASVYKFNNPNNLNQLSIGFQADDSNTNMFFGTYEHEDEQYYQMVYKPQLDIQESPSYNLIIIDYDANNTNLSPTRVINELQTSLKQLKETDFFNVVYSDFAVHFGFDEWKKVTEENINEVINLLQQSGLNSKSQLPALIPESLDHLRDIEERVNLFIISPDYSFDREHDADAFINDYKNYIEEWNIDLMLFINDYGSEFRPISFFNNKWNSGNQYFFEELIKYSGGDYFGEVRNQEFAEAMDQMFVVTGPSIDQFDIDLEPTEGLSYGEYFSENGQQHLHLNEAIIVSGKFVGSFPFKVDLNTIIENKFYKESIVIKEPNLKLDAMAPKIWHSNYLLENEFSSDFTTRNEVVRVSIII